MNDQMSSTPVQPTDSQSPTIKLWTPRLISVVTLLLGFPAGIVLTSVNCVRMNSREKALARLAAGAAGTLVFLLLVALIRDTIGSVIGLVVNFGMIFYLQRQTENDLREIRAAGAHVQKANWLGGLLIGVVVLGLVLALAFVLALFLELMGVPIPE